MPRIHNPRQQNSLRRDAACSGPSALAALVLVLACRAAQAAPSAIFATPTSADVFLTAGNISRLIVADFTGDGTPDVLTAEGLYGLNLYANDIGGFAFGDRVAAQIQYVQGLAAGQFAGPAGAGLLDLVAATDSGEIFVLRNDADHRFSKSLRLPDDGTPNSCAFGDFNADGRTDVAWVDGWKGWLNVALQRPNGGLDPASSYPSTSNPSRLFVGDFDGDGRDDVIVGDGFEPNFWLHRNLGSVATPDRVLTEGTRIPTLSEQVTLVSANLGGSPLPDLVIIPKNANYPQVNVMINLGDGAFSPATTYNLAGTPTDAAIADFNGDGSPDIAVANDSGGVQLLINGGSGVFAVQADANQITPLYEPIRGLASGDLDGDGATDIVAAYDGVQGSAFVVVRNQGQATPGTVTLQSPTAAQPVGASPAFAWRYAAASPSAPPARYTLQVALDPSFTAPIIDQPGLTSPSFTAPRGSLSSATTYHWRVIVETAGAPARRPVASSTFTTRNFADASGDGRIDMNDVMAVLTNWGSCPASGRCDSDINNDGAVGVPDLIAALDGAGFDPSGYKNSKSYNKAVSKAYKQAVKQLPAKRSKADQKLDKSRLGETAGR